LMRVNHNVFLNLALSALYGISQSLWSGTAYVAYLKKVGHNSNGPVGDIEAVSGLASLVCALPIGYLADKIGRSIVIRAGGILLLCTSILQIGILEWVGTDFDHGDGNGDSVLFEGSHAEDQKQNLALWLMGGIMVFWGLGDGVVNGPCQALFADSTPEGDRSTYFTYQFVCYITASAVGPLVSIVLFQTLGDEWDMYHLRIVIYVGLGMEVFNAGLMMLFDDSKALDEVETGGDDTDEESSSPELSSLQKRQEWIPYIIFAHSIISSLGSGMTVKFFPLFFKDEVGMTPSQVQLIYCLVPLMLVVLSALCTKIAKSGFGRVQTSIVYYVVGISLLLTMVFCKSYLDDHPFLLVPIYVMRTGLMNAPYPQEESILMDFVPKDKRARWKSLDSIATFGWCGSAALGGYIADKYDYTHTFMLTAIFQTVSVGVYCLLLPLVPRVEGSQLAEDAELAPPQQNEDDEQEDALTELSEPLL